MYHATRRRIGQTIHRPAREWDWFWRAEVPSIVLPFMAGSGTALYDPRRRKLETGTGSGFAWRDSPYGRIVDLANPQNQSRDIINLGLGAGLPDTDAGCGQFFRDTRRWTVFALWVHDTTNVDDHTVCYFRRAGVNEIRMHLFMSDGVGARPIVVQWNHPTGQTTGTSFINVGDYVAVAVTNDGTDTTAKLYTLDDLGNFQDDGVAVAQGTTTGNPSGNAYIGARNDQAPGDGHDGGLVCFYYLHGVEATRDQVRQLTLDPRGPFRQRRDLAVNVAAAAVQPHFELRVPTIG